MSAPLDLHTDHPVWQWGKCSVLTQRDVDKFIAVGVDPAVLVQGRTNSGVSIVRDRITTSPHRFEFSRYSRTDFLDCSAYVALTFDRDGEPNDLVAWRTGFIGSWLGRCGLLGEEQLDSPRFGEPLLVHPDVLTWLQAGRDGVVVVDPARAAPLLRDAGPIEVASLGERKALLDVMRTRLPDVTIRSAKKAVAA